MDKFEVRINYKRFDDEKSKDVKVNESYIVEAVSYTDAEAIITQVLNEYSLRDVHIRSIKSIPDYDIYTSQNYKAEDGYKWYRVKMSVLIDEGKRCKQVALVRGEDIPQCIELLTEKMKDILVEWNTISVTETDIYEIIKHV